uniref:Replication factor A C-terminal domain-containing protein n=1 Tax=Brassica campestris TaxID=3711 RepID=A0A3P5ZCJ9_BRACM|nr:unnamed protein product [Brassica rapa]
MAMKPHGKSIVSSDYDEKVLFLKDLSLGPHEAQLRFRLIHFWEAWNPLKKTLIGMEMLLIDEQGTVIQGFISPGRNETYLPKMKRGSVYKLDNFYGSRNKSVFGLLIILLLCRSHGTSELTVLLDCPSQFDDDRFGFIHMKSFRLTAISKETSTVSSVIPTFLINVVGHMKLVNGQSIHEAPYHFFCSGPVMKLYLWDQAAREFCKKFKSYEGTPTVLLVTTVNTKTLGGTLALTSMSSSRVFMDYDVQPTIDYFSWLGSNPDIAEQVNAEVVTKRETMTIGEIFSYIEQESAKDAFFECTATIDDVVHGSSWYYIACSGCHSKVSNGPTSLLCTNKKCGKVNVSGVPQYLSKISVYDNSDQAVLFYLEMRSLSWLGSQHRVSRSYFEANGNERVNLEAYSKL